MDFFHPLSRRGAALIRRWISRTSSLLRLSLASAIAKTVLALAEIAALDQINAARSRPPRLANRTLAAYALQIAMLGGYLARAHDPPPGNMVLWRGITGRVRPSG
jgi:hypothetical protein